MAMKERSLLFQVLGGRGSGSAVGGWGIGWCVREGVCYGLASSLNHPLSCECELKWDYLYSKSSVQLFSYLRNQTCVSEWVFCFCGYHWKDLSAVWLWYIKTQLACMVFIHCHILAYNKKKDKVTNNTGFVFCCWVFQPEGDEVWPHCRSFCHANLQQRNGKICDVLTSWQLDPWPPFSLRFCLSQEKPTWDWASCLKLNTGTGSPCEPNPTTSLHISPTANCWPWQ